MLRYAISASIASDREIIKKLPPYESLMQLLLPSNYLDRERENRVWVSAADEMLRDEALKSVYRQAMMALIDEIEKVILTGQSTGLFQPTGDVRQCSWKLAATAITLTDYLHLNDSCLTRSAVDELVTMDIRLTLGMPTDRASGDSL